MELTALLVFVGGFAVCAGIVFLVSFFGAKEQTFEEALAAQRKKNEKVKSKTKDKKKEGGNKKKSQKWNKKKEASPQDVKHEEEAEVEEPVFVEQIVEPEDLPLSSEDEHIQYVEEQTQDAEEYTEEVEEEIQVEEEKTPEPTILENKKSKIDIEDVSDEEVVEEVVEVIEEAAVVEVVEVVEEVAKPRAVKVEAAKPSPKVAAKKSAKKQGNSAKHESKELLAIVEKTVLNDLEAQQIIDVILNKQGGSGGDGGDWVEKGKLSETSKLQKALGDAESALYEEVAKAQSLTDKMVALRRELNEEKSSKAAASRTIEEMNKSRGHEIANLTAKLTEAQCDVTVLQTQLNQQVQHQAQLEASQAHFHDTIGSLNLQLEMSNVAVGTASATAAGEKEKGIALRKELEAEVVSMREQMMAQTGESIELGEVRRELDQVMASKSQLNSEVARLQAENSSLMAEKESAKVVEKELAEVTEKLGAKQTETDGLVTGIAALKLQLESTPAPTADDSLKADLDAMTLKAAALQKEIDELKVEDCSEAELDVATKKAEDLVKENEDLKTQIQKMVAEASENEEKNKQEKIESSKVGDELVDMINRLFPELPTTSEVKEIEAAIKEQLATTPEAPAPVASSNEDTEKLEAKVMHYKNTLDQTEMMLTALQASVEEEESKWKNKLDAANEELEQVKSANATKAQDDSKCEELEKQLAKERGEKVEALEKLSTIRLEVEEWNGSDTKKGLVSANTLLSQLLTFGQQALEKETQSVDALKNQLASSTGDAEVMQL